jgi:hypothetical protein
MQVETLVELRAMQLEEQGRLRSRYTPLAVLEACKCAARTHMHPTLRKTHCLPKHIGHH